MEAKEVKNQLEKIPEHIRERFRIKMYEEREEVFIFEPASINISYVKKFKIEENEATYDIRNEKVCVTIWKESEIMQVIIYS